MSVFEKIYDVVKQIPYGKVASYGQVALLAGNPRWARVVGYALHQNPDPKIYHVIEWLLKMVKLQIHLHLVEVMFKGHY